MYPHSLFFQFVNGQLFLYILGPPEKLRDIDLHFAGTGSYFGVGFLAAH